jgi:hypothetical protein
LTRVALAVTIYTAAIESRLDHIERQLAEQGGSR